MIQKVSGDEIQQLHNGKKTASVICVGDCSPLFEIYLSLLSSGPADLLNHDGRIMEVSGR